jgi:hypothetical protein
MIIPEWHIKIDGRTLGSSVKLRGVLPRDFFWLENFSDPPRRPPVKNPSTCV